VGVDAEEQGEQLRALLGAERGHDVLVDAVQDAVELGEAALAVGSDGDDIGRLSAGSGARWTQPPSATSLRTETGPVRLFVRSGEQARDVLFE
jgi:hypothetical protein